MTPIASIEQLAESYDLLVVGAGPAGLSAAARAAELGLSVLLADENPAPGGQIYRAVTTSPVKNRAILGDDYWRGADIVARFERSQATYAARCTVWSIGPDETAAGSFELGLSLDGKARIIGAKLGISSNAKSGPSVTVSPISKTPGS